MTAPKASKHTPLPEDVLKDLRDHARTYIKLDLTYIAGIGAALTALKIAQPAMFEAIASGARFGYALVFLIVFDTLVASWLSGEWIDVRLGSGDKTHPNLSRVLASAQAVAHAIFIGFALIFVVARSEGYYEILWVYRAEAELQESVERFAVLQKRYPTSIDELRRTDPTVASIVERLNRERFSYQTVEDHDYRLTFYRSELDRGINRVVTHEFQLRPIVTEDEKSAPLP